MKLSISIAFFAIALSFSQAHATMVSFDDGDEFYQAAQNPASSQSGGAPLIFDDFEVRGSLSLRNLTPASRFDTRTRFKHDDYRAYQESGRHTGLGVYRDDGHIGADNSFQSNKGKGPRKDEVLFFSFNEMVSLTSVWFNGNHTSEVNHGSRKGSNAIFNIFYNDSDSFEGIYKSVFVYTDPYRYAQAPTDHEFLNVNGGGAKFWAVAATGWGDHSSYVEGISYTEVPEPGTIFLLGLGLVGLVATRRKSVQR